MPNSICWALRALVLMAALVGLHACNQASCDGLHPPSDSPQAPDLVLVELVEQRQDNPWSMIFAVSFIDRDGDLGAGKMDIFTGASTPAQIELQSFLESSQLQQTATSGRFALPLTLAQGGVADDTTLRLGFQLHDAAGHYSNCYSIELHFDVAAVDGKKGQVSPSQNVLDGAVTGQGPSTLSGLTSKAATSVSCKRVSCALLPQQRRETLSSAIPRDFL